MPIDRRKVPCALSAAVVLTACAVPASAATTQPADGVEGEPAPLESLAVRLGNAEKLTGDWGGLRGDLEAAGFTMDLSWQSHYQQNFRGGLDTHNSPRYTDSYDWEFELDFKKMKLIPGGSFYVKAKGGSNESLNDDDVGAISNVNADPYEHSLFVRKWWYRQVFLGEKLEFRLGRVQTHKDLFDVSLYANHEDEDFLNRSSFRNPLIPHEAAIGAYARVKPVEWFYFQAAALDAQVQTRTRTGFDTAFHEEDRFIGMWELAVTPEWKSTKGRMPGKYRLGWWYDPTRKKEFEDDLDRRREPEFESGDVGLYLGGDQMVWKEQADPDDRQGLGVFARYGTADDDVNQVSRYWQAGVSYTGLLPGRDKDVTGFAFSQLVLSKKYREETEERADRESVYEWCYRIQVTPWFTISPDLQVVTNPGGLKDARDAIVGGVRFCIIF